MDNLIALLGYIVLGYGVQRTMKATKSSIGNEMGTMFITLLIWPILMSLAAFNDDLYE